MQPLLDRWWLSRRSDPTVRNAVLFTLAKKWPEVIRKGLRNRHNNGYPIQLKVVDRTIGWDRSTRSRLFKGELPINLELLYGFASLLGIEVEEFLPQDVMEFVAEVTRLVAPEISPGSAYLYAVYMWFNPVVSATSNGASHRNPDPAIVHLASDYLRDEGRPFEEEVLSRIVTHVGESLQKHLAHLD